MGDAVPYSLLITDDDASARETLRDVFEPAGFQTFLAASGEEAIDIVQRQPVHLALFDMHLPRIDGLEAFSIVRQIRGGVPAILITADQDEDLLRRALSAHMFCVLAKPVSPRLAMHTVQRAIQKYYWTS